MTLLSSPYCKRIQQSWCLPDVWLQHFGVKIFYSCCEKFKHLLLTLVLLTLTLSILLLRNCENNFPSWSWYKGGISRIQPARAFFEVCCRKEFDHHSHGFSAHTLQVYQSPVLYAWTMLNDHLVGFSPIHVCWRLHFSELLAGVLSSSKTLKPLQLVHHSMPTSSLLLHLSTSDCLPAIGATVIDLLSSPLWANHIGFPFPTKLPFGVRSCEVDWKKMLFWNDDLVSLFLLDFQAKKSFSHPNKTTACWAVVYTEQGTSKSTLLLIANRGPS